MNDNLIMYTKLKGSTNKMSSKNTSGSCVESAHDK